MGECIRNDVLGLIKAKIDEYDLFHLFPLGNMLDMGVDYQPSAYLFSCRIEIYSLSIWRVSISTH